MTCHVYWHLSHIPQLLNSLLKLNNLKSCPRLHQQHSEVSMLEAIRFCFTWAKLCMLRKVSSPTRFKMDVHVEILVSMGREEIASEFYNINKPNRILPVINAVWTCLYWKGLSVGLFVYMFSKRTSFFIGGLFLKSILKFKTVIRDF